MLAAAAACTKPQTTEQGQSGARAGASSSGLQVGQAAPPRPAGGSFTIYRGSLGERAIELKLTRDGERVSGSYAYDGIGQELRLEGRADAGDKLALDEFDPSGARTGKWACESKKEDGSDADVTCKWAKPDGRGEMYVALYEQQVAFASSSLRVVAKTVENRKAGVRASYPQLAAGDGAQLSSAAEHFNALLEKKVGDEARGFGEEMESEPNIYFHANYNVLAATDDLVSVELVYDSYGGGAHPNLDYDAVNYDLRADRELKIEDVFKPNSGYEKAVAAYCFKDINARARQMEEEDAKQERRKPEPSDEPAVPADELESINAFGVTPRGLVIYYALPHVVAVFDRNFVPYPVVKDKLKPDSPAARFAQ
ncbi:MAG: DUF3298 domain-containing protein [Pyrinomonadaceae bacterium]